MTFVSSIQPAVAARSLAIRFRTSLISADSARDVPQQRFGRVFALNPGMKEGEGKGREQGARQARERDGGRRGLCRTMEELYAWRDSDSARRAGKAYSHGKRVSQNWPLGR